MGFQERPRSFSRAYEMAVHNANLRPGPPQALRLDSLFEEQRWEQITKLPAPNVAEKRAWLRRGIAFAQLDHCGRAIPALERGVPGSSPDLLRALSAFALLLSAGWPCGAAGAAVG